MDYLPEWFEGLDEEDIVFIKRFLMASGSLKQMAKEYDVTYPTVRLRLDRLIQKVKLADNKTNEPYVSLIKNMVLEDKLDYGVGKQLIEEYRKIERG